MLYLTLILALVAATALSTLLLAALQPVLGWLAEKLYDGLKTIIPWWDNQPALYHQIAAPFLQFAFGFLTNATAAAALTDIHAVDAGWIGGILVALVAAGVKRWEKSKDPVDATVTLAASRASTGASGTKARH